MNYGASFFKLPKAAFYFKFELKSLSFFNQVKLNCTSKLNMWKKPYGTRLVYNYIPNRTLYLIEPKRQSLAEGSIQAEEKL